MKTLVRSPRPAKSKAPAAPTKIVIVQHQVNASFNGKAATLYFDRDTSKLMIMFYVKSRNRWHIVTDEFSNVTKYKEKSRKATIHGGHHPEKQIA